MPCGAGESPAERIKAMTNEQIKVFEELLKDDSFKGKSSLKHLLWRNTTQPKYKEGDRVIVTDRSTSVWGNRVENFVGVIKKCFTYAEQDEYRYGIDIPVINGTKTIMAYTALDEHEIKPCNVDITINEVIAKDKNALTSSI